jgi:hypothetical protein
MMKRVENETEKNIEKIVATAMKYDISDVMGRYAEKTRLPAEVLKEHEREIKRFLALSAANPGKYGMRGPLDELWHTFIIFTSSYAKFCQLLGGGFIHHLPRAPKSKPGGELEHNGYANFLQDYKKVFNETPPTHLWPHRMVGDLENPSCNHCGQWCSQTCAAIELMPAVNRY